MKQSGRASMVFFALLQSMQLVTFKMNEEDDWHAVMLGERINRRRRHTHRTPPATAIIDRPLRPRLKISSPTWSEIRHFYDNRPDVRVAIPPRNLRVVRIRLDGDNLARTGPTMSASMRATTPWCAPESKTLAPFTNLCFLSKKSQRVPTNRCRTSRAPGDL